MIRLQRSRLLAAALPLVLAACSLNPGATWDARMQTRQAALAQAVPMPDETQVRTQDWEWTRQTPEGERPLPVRAYWPTISQAGQQLPLLVFSHGLGGSREGYSYLGKYLAANGFAVLHLQHIGSDRSVWGGPALELVSRLQKAAQPGEALARVEDVHFAIDRAIDAGSLPFKVDSNRIAIGGHSYGANTSLLVAGAKPVFEGRSLNLADQRVRAAIIISAPPFYGQGDFNAILGGALVPALHITATGDEITIPGYHSDPADRIRVYEAYGAKQKSLLLFKDGSHSMFTDRLNTGGNELNPKVKLATREAALAFLQQTLHLPATDANALNWPARFAGIIAASK